MIERMPSSKWFMKGLFIRGRERIGGASFMRLSRLKRTQTAMSCQARLLYSRVMNRLRFVKKRTFVFLLYKFVSKLLWKNRKRREKTEEYKVPQLMEQWHGTRDKIFLLKRIQNHLNRSIRVSVSQTLYEVNRYLLKIKTSIERHILSMATGFLTSSFERFLKNLECVFLYWSALWFVFAFRVVVI